MMDGAQIGVVLEVIHSAKRWSRYILEIVCGEASWLLVNLRP
jgi:hypothetical protein